MTKKKLKYCPICKIPVTSVNHMHVHKDKPYDVYKVEFYIYNFPLLSDKDKLEELYTEKKYSLPMLCDYVGGIDLKSMCYMLNHYNIRIRSISESLTDPIIQLRYLETCIKKYGAPNALSKGTEPYKKRNKTVIDKYGVENVFLCIDDFITEYGYKKSKISSLNKRIEQILKTFCIEYKAEFRILYITDNGYKAYKFYDFLLLGTNILLEVLGNYWHANPEIYSANDEFQFPKIKLTADDIWKMDDFKRNLAKVNNYVVKYLWESDIKKLTDTEIYENIKNFIN